MYLIGIAGGSGSGKTTFVKNIKKQLSNQPITFISLDDYYFPRDEQFVDNQGVTNFDLPSSIDSEALVRDIKQLKANQVVTRKEYTFNNKLATPKMLTFEPNPIIIIEGLFVYHYAELNDLLDFRVYVYASIDTSLIRRVKRDRIERNYPLEDVLYRYEHHVMPSYKKYIEPYKDMCDIVINNFKHMNQAEEMFLTFLHHKLLPA